jgi:two-component system LytT family response regulator
VVRAADIEWVEAAANYVVLHTSQGNHVLRRTLAVIEAELDSRCFFRLSRSALVCLAAIREVQAVSAGEHMVLLQSGARLSLTRGLRELQGRLQSTT